MLTGEGMHQHLLGIVLCLAPFSAFAAGESAAVVAVDGCTEELTAGSARLLRAALAAHSNLQVQSEDQTIEALGGAPRGSFEDAERLIAGARLDPFGAGSRRSLRDAMAILTALPPSEPRRWQAMSEVLAFQAMLASADHRAEAELTLERILRVAPTFQLDRDRYSPDMWKLADKVRADVKARATSTLRVSTQPPGLPVAVDGHVVGTAPISMKVPAGEYRVEAVFGGPRSLARTVHVESVTSVELDQSFDGAIRVGSGPCLTTNGERAGRLTPLVKLATILGVSKIVGVWQETPVPGETYVVAGVIDPGTGEELREAKVRMPAGRPVAAVIDKLGLFVAGGAAPSPVEALVTKPRPVTSAGAALSPQALAEAASRSSRRSWGIGVGGAGLALVAGAVAFDVMAHSAYQAEKDAIQAKDAARYQSEKSSAKTKGTIAKALYVGGAVGVGVGAYLYLTGRATGSSVAVVPTEGGAIALVSGSLP
jgi:hypothetical protein